MLLKHLMFLGRYVTLSWLKNLKNGRISDIKTIVGAFEHGDVPEFIVQRGPFTNYEEFTARFYFKRQSELSVTFAKEDGKVQTTKLNNLIQVTHTLTHTHTHTHFSLSLSLSLNRNIPPCCTRILSCTI